MQVPARFVATEQKSNATKGLEQQKYRTPFALLLCGQRQTGTSIYDVVFPMMIANNAVPDVTRDVWRSFYCADLYVPVIFWWFSMMEMFGIMLLELCMDIGFVFLGQKTMEIRGDNLFY